MSLIRTLARSVFGNAYLLMVLATLSWAGNTIAGRMAAGTVSPATLTFFRWLLALIVVFVFAWRHVLRDRAVIIAHWRRLFVMGLLGFTGFCLALYGALEYTTALNAAIEQSCMPVAIMLGGYLVFRQPFGTIQAFGVILSVLGVLVTVTSGHPQQLLENGLNRGDAIMMLAVAFYSAFTLLLRHKPIMHWLSLFVALAFAALIASIPTLALEIVNDEFIWPSARGWLIILYTVFFPSLVSQICFVRGVELIGANRASAFMNLVPIFAAVMAVLILQEAFQLYHLVGLVLVLGGIALAERFAIR